MAPHASQVLRRERRIGHLIAGLRGALAWRLRRVVGDRRLDAFIVSTAQVWRAVLKKPVFIGIAGSAGKTTTKELLHGLLARQRSGVANAASLNVLPEVAKTIWRTRPGHDFCVVELSEDRPGVMDGNVALLRPDVAIVTVLRDDHLSAHASRDALAHEVHKLVTALPTAGTAVLNADDERVRVMARDSRARVITFGISTQADLRAEDVHSVWPERLQMTLVYGGERVALRTQLCGTHWVPSVLGAIGGGLAAGLSLAECATGIATVAPFEARMQPVFMPDGVTFIRDDFKAPMWTLDACFEFMRSATAVRKIVVMGEISEFGSKKERSYAKLASKALVLADIVIVVGRWASAALSAKKPGTRGVLHVFTQVQAASEFLNSIARPGDLILLKGVTKQDHLNRIVLARSNGVACWRDDCRRMTFCDVCPERMKPSGSPLWRGQAAEDRAVVADVEAAHATEQFIAGLGNPGPQYIGTPHNVGFELVEQLAVALQWPWRQHGDAWMARGHYKSLPVCLLKLETAMNLTGGGLHRLAMHMGFGPEQCVLVFDDMTLPSGTVRVRQNGSAGGHRGVASVLEAFQSDAFRRVKIGVAPSGSTVNRVDYVLQPLDDLNRKAVDKGLAAARAPLETMLTRAAESSGGVNVTCRHPIAV